MPLKRLITPCVAAMNSNTIYTLEELLYVLKPDNLSWFDKYEVEEAMIHQEKFSDDHNFDSSLQLIPCLASMKTDIRRNMGASSICHTNNLHILTMIVKDTKTLSYLSSAFADYVLPRWLFSSLPPWLRLIASSTSFKQVYTKLRVYNLLNSTQSKPTHNRLVDSTQMKICICSTIVW